MPALRFRPIGRSENRNGHGKPRPNDVFACDWRGARFFLIIFCSRFILRAKLIKYPADRAILRGSIGCARRIPAAVCASFRFFRRFAFFAQIRSNRANGYFPADNGNNTQIALICAV